MGGGECPPRRHHLRAVRPCAARPGAGGGRRTPCALRAAPQRQHRRGGGGDRGRAAADLGGHSGRPARLGGRHRVHIPPQHDPTAGEKAVGRGPGPVRRGDGTGAW